MVVSSFFSAGLILHFGGGKGKCRGNTMKEDKGEYENVFLSSSSALSLSKDVY